MSIFRTVAIYILLLLCFAAIGSGASGANCITFYNDGRDPLLDWTGDVKDPNYLLALELMKSKDIDSFYKDKNKSNIPPTISFSELVAGLDNLKPLIFPDTDAFILSKTKGWTLDTNFGTNGYKSLQIIVAVRLKNEKIKLVPIFLFDKEGSHGSHRELALLASETFGEQEITYLSRFDSLYYGQIVISKFKDQNFFEYIDTNSHPIRVHAEWHLEKDKPMPASWRQDIIRVEL
ncbi:MAG: hypothetical protein JNL11_19495 [Bdellovibrionaceae bacterium]|nr:hypothetical protein [Pseudobdellovibrionaceae bacterium]